MWSLGMFVYMWPRPNRIFLSWDVQTASWFLSLHHDKVSYVSTKFAAKLRRRSSRFPPDPRQPTQWMPPPVWLRFSRHFMPSRTLRPSLWVARRPWTRQPACRAGRGRAGRLRADIDP